MEESLVQLFGFAGSLLIIVSATMRTIIRLRLFALTGTMVFVVYAIALGAWPVVATNIMTSMLHLYHLQAWARERRASRSPVEATRAPSPTPAPSGAA